MYRILALCCSLGVVLGRQSAAPHHDAEHLPNTAFSCRDKVLGGYYADPDAQCQMFHVCVKVAGVGIQDYRFLCPNGTAFDQEAQICAGWADVACEPAALYYSSDNFDLYRIGSGFESKKAPVASEEESDFHLQRAEPDILSGAHSSNFFNNREGKDVQDTQKNGGQSRNQVDQPQRKKVVKKLQRRPVESSFAPSSTQRQITNNLAASFVPTTSRPSSISTQTLQSRDNFNNQHSYQPFKQASTTLAPSEFEKISISSYSSNDYKKTTPQVNNYNRNYNQRHPSTSNYNYNSESSATFSDKQKNVNNDELSKKSVSNPENRNYNTENLNNYKSTRQPGRRNKERGQHTYKAQQTSSKVNYNSESSTTTYDKQFSPQYNANTNSQNSQQNTQYNFNQESTQRYNKYNGGDDRNNNQETTYQIKYNNPSTQQTTPRYNQDFKNKNYQTQTTQGNSYNNEGSQLFEKTKLSPRYDDKITQFSAKQSTPQYDLENSNNKKNTNIPQTPPPKFNTNLLYDNNQQSTPDYYKTDNNREYKTNQPPSSANKQQYSSSDYNQYNQQKSQGNSQYSTAETSSFNQGISQSQKYQQETIAHAQKFSSPQLPSFNQGVSQTTKSYESIDNAQKLSTARVSSFNQGTVQSQKSYEPKITPNAQRISTAQPSYFNQGVIQSQKSTSNVQINSTPGPSTSGNKRYEIKSTPAVFKSSNSDDYDDGQYRPELYERESGGEYDLTDRNNARKEVSPRVSQDADVYKAAKQNIRKEVSPQASQDADVYKAAKQNIRKEVSPQVSQGAEVYKAAKQNVRKEVSFQAPQESEYLKSITQNARKEIPLQASQEVEFLKTAHSINIAASGNQLARERRPPGPLSTTPAPVTQQQRVTTPFAPRTVQTTPSPKNVYANIAAVTSAAPRPFSVRTEQSSSPLPQQKKFVEAKKPTNSAPSKAKDVSYDYAYYDNSEPYSEYDNIEEFGRTSRKQ